MLEVNTQDIVDRLYRLANDAVERLGQSVEAVVPPREELLLLLMQQWLAATSCALSLILVLATIAAGGCDAAGASALRDDTTSKVPKALLLQQCPTLSYTTAAATHTCRLAGAVAYGSQRYWLLQGDHGPQQVRHASNARRCTAGCAGSMVVGDNREAFAQTSAAVRIHLCVALFL